MNEQQFYAKISLEKEKILTNVFSIKNEMPYKIWKCINEITCINVVVKVSENVSGLIKNAIEEN